VRVKDSWIRSGEYFPDFENREGWGSQRLKLGSARRNCGFFLRMGAGFFLCLTLALACVGCGYHTAGHAVTVPENVRTLAIPSFVNLSQTYRIEQTLTSAVVHEFTTRTHYQILNETSDAADATLRGTVLSTTSSPLTYDSKTGRAESILVVVSMRVSLTDRQGKVLFQNPSYVFREQYQVSQEPSSFFEEDSPAMGRLSRDFAHTLVSSVLEGF
jgi:outer membrane lipopolysaccharide assembly protein LptE/RlpB